MEHQEIPTSSDTTIFGENSFYKETQEDIWQHERTKLMWAMFSIGLVYLVGDLISIFMANLHLTTYVTIAFIVPAIFLGIGLLGKWKPMMAIVLGALLFVAIIGFQVYETGAVGIIRGLLAKALIIYLLIKGYNHAREAEEARKNLDLLH